MYVKCTINRKALYAYQELSLSETIFEPVCKSCLSPFSQPVPQAGEENTRKVQATVLQFTEEEMEAREGEPHV